MFSHPLPNFWATLRNVDLWSVAQRAAFQGAYSIHLKAWASHLHLKPELCCIRVAGTTRLACAGSAAVCCSTAWQCCPPGSKALLSSRAACSPPQVVARPEQPRSRCSRLGEAWHPACAGLAAALKGHPGLTYLELGCNALGEEGIKFLADAIKFDVPVCPGCLVALVRGLLALRVQP